jgi:WhiB family redox-sensing transcriptional regulator
VTVAQLSRLPKPLFASYEWQWHAACAQANPHMFFHPEDERGPARQRRDRDAVAVCAVCPVRDACRAHGLSVREPYGVWGGLTESDREQIYQQEGRTSFRAISAG